MISYIHTYIFLCKTYCLYLERSASGGSGSRETQDLLSTYIPEDLGQSSLSYRIHIIEQALHREDLHTEDHPRRHEVLPNPFLNEEQSFSFQLEPNPLAGQSRLTSSPITYQPRYSPGSCLLCLPASSCVLPAPFHPSELH